MKYPHLWGRLYGAPLIIHPEKAAVIEGVFRRLSGGELGLGPAQEGAHPEHDLEAVRPLHAGVKYRRGTDKSYAITESGIAVLPILGTLIQRGDWLDAMSGLMSYGRIQALAERASEDPDVKGTLLEVDSYGGEAFGLFELCSQLVLLGKQKPIWAHVNEQAYSAAYAVACAASRILVPPTGCLGSIGVIMLHVDQSKRDVQQGYGYEYIYAGARKKDFNAHEPLSDEARATAQAEVDRSYGFFVRHVAERRNISEKAVRATEAGILNPETALEGGYVDALVGFSEAVALLEREVSSKSIFPPGARTAASQSTSPRKETSMANENPGAAATLTAEQQQAHTAEVQAARTEGEKAGRAAGVTAERERIGAILGCDEAKGRTKLAQTLALKTDTAPAQAKELLASSPVEAAGPANPLLAAMNGVPNPKVGAAGELGTGAEEDADAMARRISGYGAAPASATRQ